MALEGKGDRKQSPGTIKAGCLLETPPHKSKLDTIILTSKGLKENCLSQPSYKVFFLLIDLEFQKILKSFKECREVKQGYIKGTGKAN